mgnify:CR=1 FL=1
MRQWFVIAMVCAGLSGCAVEAVGSVVDAVMPDKKPDQDKDKK